MVTRLSVRFALREALGIASTGVALFWSAGTMAWWPAWAVLGITSAWVVSTAVVILRRNPSLLAERLGPRPGAKRWDTALMSVHGLLQLGVYIVGGLDRRYAWSAGPPLVLQIAGLVGCALGYALVVWATASNPFFSQIVRIQTERGHTVADGGPYRAVRHPANAGGVLIGVALGIATGSSWAVLIGAADAVLMVARTALEDRALRAELRGYGDYASRVRYRLIPGIW